MAATASDGSGGKLEENSLHEAIPSGEDASRYSITLEASVKHDQWHDLEDMTVSKQHTGLKAELRRRQAVLCHVLVRRSLQTRFSQPLIPLWRQLICIVVITGELHPAPLFHAIFMLLHLAATTSAFRLMMLCNDLKWVYTALMMR